MLETETEEYKKNVEIAKRRREAKIGNAWLNWAVIVAVLVLSGGLAGLAGSIELSGNSDRLTEGLSNGYGFAGIIVAALALMRPWSVLPVAVVFAAVQVGGNSIQTLGVPSSVADILQALILAGALVATVLVSYRIRWVPVTRRGAAVELAPAAAETEVARV